MSRTEDADGNLAASTSSFLNGRTGTAAISTSGDDRLAVMIGVNEAGGPRASRLEFDPRISVVATSLAAHQEC